MAVESIHGCLNVGLERRHDAPDLVSPGGWRRGPRRGRGSAMDAGLGTPPRRPGDHGGPAGRGSARPSRPWPPPPVPSADRGRRPPARRGRAGSPPCRGPARSSRSVGTTASTHVEGGASRRRRRSIFAKWPSSVIGHGAEIRWDPGADGPGRLRGRARRRHRPDGRVASTRPTRSTTSWATRASTTSRRATCSSATASGRAASRSTRSARWGRSLVTADEIPRPAGPRHLRAASASEVLQQANTAEMYFGVAAIISHCSQAFTPGARRRHRDRDARRRRDLPRSADPARRWRRGDHRDRADRPADEHLPLRASAVGRMSP